MQATESPDSQSTLKKRDLKRLQKQAQESSHDGEKAQNSAQGTPFTKLTQSRYSKMPSPD
jgi:hypothetical protein